MLDRLLTTHQVNYLSRFMQNLPSDRPSISARLSSLLSFDPISGKQAARCNWSLRLLPGLISLAIVGYGGGMSLQGLAAEPVPPSLGTTLNQVDIAANSNNLEAVMAFYAPGFVNSDGLNRQNLQSLLQDLWQRYDDLTYKTEVLNWRAEGNGFIVETLTRITGSQVIQGRQFSLTAEIKSRQLIEQGQIVRQDILAERSQLTSGSQPPTVKVNLPEQVQVGGEFNFDAIVQEPLGDGYLLGAVTNEPVKIEQYFGPAPTELELLSTGGIFKIGTAPNQPANRWISVILIREDGMTLVTQRLRVVAR